jgi:hypothetical protein
MLECKLEGTAMKWIAFVLLLVSGCVAQQMDEKNDPALQLTIYTPHRISISKERQGNNVLNTVWVVSPFIAETFDHTNKLMGIFVELHGNKQVLNPGVGGLMFTVDGKEVAVSPAVLAHSHKQESCALTRCTAKWVILPKTPAEDTAMATFVKAVADGHEVYATMLPGDNGSGQRFTAKLTDEQLLEFHDVRQYYESLVLAKKISQAVAQ